MIAYIGKLEAVRLKAEQFIDLPSTMIGQDLWCEAYQELEEALQPFEELDAQEPQNKDLH